MFRYRMFTGVILSAITLANSNFAIASETDTPGIPGLGRTTSEDNNHVLPVPIKSTANASDEELELRSLDALITLFSKPKYNVLSKEEWKKFASFAKAKGSAHPPQPEGFTFSRQTIGFTSPPHTKDATSPLQTNGFTPPSQTKDVNSPLHTNGFTPSLQTKDVTSPLQTKEVTPPLQTKAQENWQASGSSPNDEFKALGLHEAGVHIFDENSRLPIWIDFMKAFNSKPENKKKQITLISTLTTHYNDHGVIEIIKAAKKNPRTAIDAKRLEADQVQYWVKTGKAPGDVSKLLIPDEGADQLLASPEFRTLSKFINYYNQANPDDAVTMLALLTDRFGDARLTSILIAAHEVPSTKIEATKLQMEQFARWLKTEETPDKVFKLLQLHNVKVNLFDHQQYEYWLNYVTMRKRESINSNVIDSLHKDGLKTATINTGRKGSEEPLSVDTTRKTSDNPSNAGALGKDNYELGEGKKDGSSISIYRTLRRNFDDIVLVEFILAGKKALSPATNRIAQQMEDEIFRGWAHVGLNPDSIFELLHLHTAFEKVFHSPFWSIFANYLDFYKALFPNKEASMIRSMAMYYHDQPLAKILLVAKQDSSTKDLATDLQAEQIQHWLAFEDKPLEILDELLNEEPLDHIFDNPLFKVWMTYLEAFNKKFPNDQQFMIAVLLEKYGDEMLTYFLMSAMEISSKEDSIKLLVNTLEWWLKNGDTPEDIFRELRLHDSVETVLSNPLLYIWIPYTKLYNAKFTSAKVSVIDTIRTRFGDLPLAKMLFAAKTVEQTKNIAKRVETALIRKWIAAKMTKSNVFKLLQAGGSTKLVDYYIDEFEKLQRQILLEERRRLRG